MRFVPSDQVKKGMALARPIYSDTGSILLREGNQISDASLKHLEAMGMQGLYIEEQGFEDILVDEVISKELRYSAYDALVKGRYDLCIEYAKNMISEIKALRKKTLNYFDIKTFKNYEYQHSVSVAIYCIIYGIATNMKDDQIENLAIAGILHDIGKFDVSKRVLNSRHIYSDKQMDEMMKHPLYSYETLQSYTNVSSVTRNAILFHHENIDGSGYYNTPAEKIGLFPRILRVIDTYDALVSTRRHRAFFSPAAAFKNLAKDAGKLYDKDVVRNFINIFPMYPIGYTVKLKTGESGVVIGQTKDMQKPIIRKFDGEEIDLFNDWQYKGVTIEE